LWERPRLTGGLVGLAVAVTGWRIILTDGPTPDAPASPTDQMTGMDGTVIAVLPEVVPASQSTPAPAGPVLADLGPSFGPPVVETAAAPPSRLDAWPASPVPVTPIASSGSFVATDPGSPPQGAWLLGTIEENSADPTRTASRFDEPHGPTRY
jgi:hypothetical protein